MLAAILDDHDRLGASFDTLLSDAGWRIFRPSLDSRPWRKREIQSDLFIFYLCRDKATQTTSHYLRRLAGETPFIVISADTTVEFDYPDALDFLAYPPAPSRLRGNLDYLRVRAAKPGEPPHTAPDQEQTERFREFLHRHSGLHFDARNGKLLEHGLLRRMRAVNSRSFADYYDFLLERQESHDELKRLLSLLTVGETFFFRYAVHFDALAESVLPELIERNRSQRTLSIWSAGCSTGEEPYSLAILLLERFPQLASWNISILATDVNKRALAQARIAVYGGRTLRHVEPRLLQKWFTLLPSGQYRVNKEVRDRIKFAYLNLLQDDYPTPQNGTADLDIILCRNVLIYFQLPTIRFVVERFSRALKMGGFFFLGHSETLMHISDAFRRRQHKGGFIYQRADAAEEAPKKRPAPPELLPAPPACQTTFTPPDPPGLPATATAEEKSAPLDLEIVFAEAEDEFLKENYRTAYQKYDSILVTAPKHIGALLGKGFILAGSGAYDEALEHCNRILQLDDLSPQAYFLRGLIHDQHDDFRAAAEAYRKALLLDIRYVMPHYNLGQLLRRNGRPRDADRQLRNVIRLLEKMPTDSIIPHSGGLSAAALLDCCRNELMCSILAGGRHDANRAKSCPVTAKKTHRHTP